MTKRPSAPSGRGFTLIEVLVSLAIFAIAAVILGATYANVLMNYGAASRRTENEQDVSLVRAQIIGESDRSVVEKGGDVTLPENRSAHWDAKLEETEVMDLFHVTMHCEITGGAQTKTEVRDENFMLLRPSWSDPEARNKLRDAAAERLAKKNAR